MIIEYRGDVVSPAVADLREKNYRKEGKDCYLFHINDNLVIDATMRGAIGRFTVSAQPLLKVSGSVPCVDAI